MVKKYDTGEVKKNRAIQERQERRSFYGNGRLAERGTHKDGKRDGVQRTDESRTPDGGGRLSQCAHQGFARRLKALDQDFLKSAVQVHLAR